MKNFLVLLIIATGFQAKGVGACPSSSPPAATCNAAIAGKITAGTGDMYYCSGTAWIKFSGTTTGYSCTAGDRRIKFLAGQLLICCQTSNAYTTPLSAGNGSCSAAQAGKLAFVGGSMQYCDGTSWQQF